MIGLEYILKVNNIQQKDLADELGIKKQNLSLWFSGKQNISKKYLPFLSKKFGVSEDFLQKEICNWSFEGMKFEIGYYEVNGTKSDFLIAYKTCVKPTVGDNVKINQKLYKVLSVCIDYDDGTVHAFIERI